jgi:hypothetical protein
MVLPSSRKPGRKLRKPHRRSGRPGGHPPKCDPASTPENLRAIIADIATGMIVDAACAAHRISPPSYYLAIKKDPATLAAHNEALRSSRAGQDAEYIGKATANLLRAIDGGDTRISQWFLERRQRNTWGRSVQEPGDTGPAAGFDGDGVASEA